MKRISSSVHNREVVVVDFQSKNRCGSAITKSSRQDTSERSTIKAYLNHAGTLKW